MVFNNRLLRRRSDANRSIKPIWWRLPVIILGMGLMLATLFASYGRHETSGDDTPRDDINEEEVSVAEIPDESIRDEHEVRDVPWRPVLVGAFVLLAVAIFIHVTFWWMLQQWTGRELRIDPQLSPAIVDGREPAPQIQRLDYPGPNLQSAPALEYDYYHQQQREILESYSEGEIEEGFARIPITRAMELLAEEGLPARDGPIPDFGLEPAYRWESSGGQGLNPGGEEAVGDE